MLQFKIPDKLPSWLPTNTRWLEAQQATILSAATVITFSTIVSAISGLLVRRQLIGLFFDTQSSKEALEAFWVAFQIPDMMFQLIVLGALSAAFIPIFTTHRKKNQDEAFVMSSIMMNTLLLVFIAIGLVVFIFARPLTMLRTGDNFTPDQIEIVINLTRLMIFSQFFFAISNFMTGILQSFQRFIFPAIAPIVYNLGILVGVYLFHSQFGIYSAGFGVILGAFFHMAIQIPLVKKLGFRYNWSINWRYKGIGEFFKLMPPRVLAIGASEMRKLFLGFFATQLGSLSFFMMQLALTLMVIPIRFFGVPISQASLPFLSDEAAETDKARFRSLVLQSLHQISFLTYPASILLLILRVPVVRLVFGTSNFPWENTQITGWLVAIVAISIAAQAMVQLLIRSFYALKDTKTPFVISSIDLVLYLLITAGFVFLSPYGVYGLAIATSITAFIELVLFLVLLNHKIGGLMGKAFWVPQLKMITACFFMAVFLYLPFKIFDVLVFDTTRTIELIGITITTGTIGMLVYLLFAAVFKIQELSIIRKVLYSFGSWKETLGESSEVLVETPSDGIEMV